MENYINCIAHSSSEGQLILGGEYSVLIDCGMSFCADETISNVKTALKGSALDFIFMTHTHYDHIGALPYLKREWPQIRIVTSGIGAEVLLKSTPRRVIREFSQVAATKMNITLSLDYSDDLFQADIIVKDNDIIDLGGLTVKVLETPGHTRDALSFFIQEIGVLALNETMGVLMSDGGIYPCYLTSFHDAIDSIEKCRKIPYAFLSLPHRGIISESDAENFFDLALKANEECHAFILGLAAEGHDEESILDSFIPDTETKPCRSINQKKLSLQTPKRQFLAH
ncbi:MAG: MBL fold metallo-hydrolase [Eubacteriaceae bacterium]|nr:MBL fold metallo-hydrolase [Eubacteriaceae bacterium]